MESSSLEIKVMFGKDLKAFNFFQKLSAYVQVSIVSDDPGKKLGQKQQHRTPTDKEGDGNPEWNHEMRFDLKEVPFQDCDHIFIQFELRHEGLMFGDKTIGEVRVPIKDLLSEFNGFVRFVNYEVRSTDKKPNGVLTFSYKVNTKNSVLGTNYYPGSGITGYPIAHHPQQQASEIQYPTLDVHSSSAEVNHPVHSSQPQVNYPVHSSCPGVLYPPPVAESQTATPQTYSTQQDIQYSSHGTPHPSQESYYPPPDAYYPPPPQVPPPPPPPYIPHPPPPQSPMADGAYYPPTLQYGYNAWSPGPHMGYHTHSMPGTWGPADASGHLHSHENGETPPNGYPYGTYCHSSSWNGR